MRRPTRSSSSFPTGRHIFLGAIVISQLWTSGDQVSAHEVIDGQQRLTTFQIVMAALRDVARELGVSAIADELERYCVRNSGMMADEAEEKYKVWPTRTDVPQFNRLAAGTLDGIVEDLKSFLVRRMICGRTIKNYNRLFLQIATELRDAPKASGSIDRAAFQKVLLGKTGEAVDWPSDDAFRSVWMDQPAYDRLGSGKLEMVLLALDRELLTEKGEKISIEDELTIEHVLPQAWEEFWPLPDGPNAEKRAVARDTALHTFGNLTLLTHKLNSAVSNGPYLAKRGEITMQSGLRLNSYFQAVGAWDEDAIATRGQKLFDVAVKIWPRPQLV